MNTLKLSVAIAVALGAPLTTFSTAEADAIYGGIYAIAARHNAKWPTRPRHVKTYS